MDFPFPLPLLLDGATGTMLYEKGMPRDACPEAYVLEHPDTMLSIQSRYIDSGSACIYAPTFGANSEKLSRFALSGETSRLNRELVRLSRSARGADGRSALVGGDMTSPGLFLRPYGDTSFSGLTAIYTQQAEALEEAGVDFFTVETLMSLQEARAALLAIGRVSRKPVFVTFTCDRNGRTLSGADIRAALVTAQAMGASAFGLNCSTGPRDMARCITSLRPYAKIPLIAKPNAGMPMVVDGETMFDMKPELFAAESAALLEAGASVIGGCCGTTPAHIAALSGILPQTLSPSPAQEEWLASERALFPADGLLSEPVAFSAFTADDIADAGGDIVSLRLSSQADITTLEEEPLPCDRPVAFLADDPSLLFAALELYAGRAALDPRSSIGEEALAEAERRYGARRMQ